MSHSLGHLPSVSNAWTSLSLGLMMIEEKCVPSVSDTVWMTSIRMILSGRSSLSGSGMSTPLL